MRLPTFRQMTRDFFDSLFGLDSRLLHTVAPLLRRPGFLTSEFTAGRRARYVPPLRLYLVSSFLLFFTLTLLNTDFSRFLVQNEPETAQTETAQAAAADSSSTDSSASDGNVNVDLESVDLGEAERNAFTRQLKRGLLRMQEEPEVFWSRVMGRVPVMMFFLLPVFALLLKLLYLRSGRLYMEHFIFALHFHAFVFLALLAVSLTDAAGNGWLDGVKGMLAYGSAVVYLFFALRRVYGQSRRKTAAKIGLLLFTYPMIGFTALLVVLLVTILL